MSDYQSGYLLGVVAALALALAAYVISRKVRGAGKPGMKGEYDERQLLARGMIFRRCCFVYMVELAALMLLEGLQADIPLTRGALYAIFFLLPIGIFATGCIAKDAYIGLKSNMKQFVILGAVITVIEIIVTFRYCMAGEMIKDGKLTDSCLAPGLVILYLAIAAALFIHGRQESAEEDEV